MLRRVITFIANVSGLAIGWLSLGLLTWVSMSGQDLRWTDLGGVFTYSEAEWWYTWLLYPGLIYVMTPLSFLVPTIMVRARTPRIVVGVAHAVAALAVVLSAMFDTISSSSAPRDEVTRDAALAVALAAVVLAAGLTYFWDRARWTAVVLSGVSTLAAVWYVVSIVLVLSTVPLSIGAFAPIAALALVAWGCGRVVSDGSEPPTDAEPVADGRGRRDPRLAGAGLR